MIAYPNLRDFANASLRLMAADSNPYDRNAKLDADGNRIPTPGPANAAIGEVFGTFIIPTMFAKAARGEMTPEEAVAEAEAQMNTVFERWASEGLIGGGR